MKKLTIKERKIITGLIRYNAHLLNTNKISQTDFYLKLSQYLDLLDNGYDERLTLKFNIPAHDVKRYELEAELNGVK